ncbi:hypothetical protein ACF0H5_008397 [Mactra antiquata]
MAEGRLNSCEKLNRKVKAPFYYIYFQAAFGKSTNQLKKYSCLHCERAGKSYREARYRVMGHVLKHHLSLDETPFYCSLCMFKCTTMETLKSHVTSYCRHQLMAGSGRAVDQQKCLIHNPSARGITEGIDYCHNHVNDLDYLLLNEYYTFDNDVQEPNPSLQVDILQVNKNPLPPYQPTKKVRLSREATPLHDEPYSPTSPFLTDLNNNNRNSFDYPNISQPAVATGQSYLMMPSIPSTTQSSLVSPPSSSTSQPSLMTPPIIQPPITTATTTDPLTVSNPTVNFAEQLDSGDITLDQLLGDPIPQSPAFGNSSVSGPVTSDAQTQTDIETGSSGNSILSSKVFQECMGKIVSAIDWNSRAIKNADKTTGLIVKSINKLNRTVERMAQHLHTTSRSTDNSPPRKSVKSVVKKRN